MSMKFSLLSVLCTAFIAHPAYGALAPVPIVAIPEDLVALVAWVELSKSVSPLAAKRVIAEKIHLNEDPPHAYLIGAALNEHYGNAYTILISILNKRLLFYQGLSGPSSMLFICHYLRAYRGEGVGTAWGFRPTSIESLTKSDDLKAILSILTKDPIDIEIDLLALKKEDAWVDYDIITAYALMKKYGSGAHRKVSMLLQNRMNFIKAPASPTLSIWAAAIPLFIDSLITPAEYQEVVKKFPALSLELHDGRQRKPHSFIWEIYQHTWITIDTYVSARLQQNLPLLSSTKLAKKMTLVGSISERCAAVHGKVLELLIAEKMGNTQEESAARAGINAIFAGAE